ncbi:MAG: hypothetical protein ACYDA6_10325 [Solirubrobacteraceae bacterium]
MPPLSHPGHALASAQLDPLLRNHVHLVALALIGAGIGAGEAQIVRHMDPWALDVIARERLGGTLGHLVLRYLHALTPVQCRIIAQAQNRMEAEMDLHRRLQGRPASRLDVGGSR